MSEALIQFDDPPRNGLSEPQPATARIAATLKSAGIDAPNSLYDESLALARDGHLGQAQARLQMLLCLDPDDADALLLLAKIHLAQGRPVEALARLDGAVAAGGLPPAGFREQVEQAIRAERAREEDHRARIAAREQGEIRSLRHETRTLRSEQVRLETELAEARLRERNWKYASLGTSLLATLVIVLLVAANAGGGADEAALAEAPSAPPIGAVDGAAEAGATETAAAAPGAAAGSAPIVASITPPTDGPALAAAAPSAAAPSAAAPSAAAPSGTVEAPAASATAAPPPTPKDAAPSGDEVKKPVGGGRTHVVAQGDTLQKLAARYYGDGSRWPEIQAANRKVLKKGVGLSIGMKIQIP